MFIVTNSKKQQQQKNRQQPSYSLMDMKLWIGKLWCMDIMQALKKGV